MNRSSFCVIIFLFNRIFCDDQVNLTCRYESAVGEVNKIPYNFNKCTIDGPLVINQQPKIISINSGQFHRNSINFFFARGKSMKCLPQALGETFENLQLISVTNNEIAEIRTENMKTFKKLEIFVIYANSIEFLEANLFQHNQHLHYIDLSSNKIDFVDPLAFNGLNNLKYLDLLTNICINLNADNECHILKLMRTASGNCKNQIKSDELCGQDKINTLENKIKEFRRDYDKMSEELKVLKAQTINK